MEKGVNHFKNVLYWWAGIIAIVIIGFIIAFIIYDKNINKNYSSITGQNLSEALEKEIPETESASTEMGKTVEESMVENTNDIVRDEDNIKLNNINSTSNETKVQETKKDEVKQIPDPTFIRPVDGETQKEFARDNLIYSETLNEWVTHNGIDIKADKATVVKAAADGKVIAIKNDPRYGITIIIEHDNGYETRYSNLLTAEFVNEGEKVTQGQTIGTVGNTAVFEVLDDPHLHFEILKNGEYLDPNLFIK